MGFITVRCFRLHECDPVDRAAMGLQSRLLDACEARPLRSCKLQVSVQEVP